MKKVELLKILREGLKMLSQCEVMRDDYRYIGMYEEFQNMRRCGLKYREAVRHLAKDYKIGRATVERVISRLDGDVKKPQ
jgi:hypothetical protein